MSFSVPTLSGAFLLSMFRLRHCTFFIDYYKAKKEKGRCQTLQHDHKNIMFQSSQLTCTPPLIIVMSCLFDKCDPLQDFNAKGESTRTTRFHFKTKEFILTRFSTLAILPH